MMIRAQWLLERARDEQGATAVEYAILAACIAAVIVTIVIALGVQVLGLFGSVPAF
jgi:Flp pilus assembly pilin Flp